MTYGELKTLVGKRPFVWHRSSLPNTTIYSQICEEEQFPLGLEEDGVLKEPSIITAKPIPGDSQILTGFILVDYFDDFVSAPQNGTCQCEWVSVLQYGCKCGAIIPYEEKSK